MTPSRRRTRSRCSSPTCAASSRPRTSRGCCTRSAEPGTSSEPGPGRGGRASGERYRTPLSRAADPAEGRDRRLGWRSFSILVRVIDGRGRHPDGAPAALGFRPTRWPTRRRSSASSCSRARHAADRRRRIGPTSATYAARRARGRSASSRSDGDGAARSHAGRAATSAPPPRRRRTSRTATAWSVARGVVRAAALGRRALIVQYGAPRLATSRRPCTRVRALPAARRARRQRAWRCWPGWRSRAARWRRSPS